MEMEDTESLSGLPHRDWPTDVKKAWECGEETLLWKAVKEPFLHLSSLSKVDVTGNLHTV